MSTYTYIIFLISLHHSPSHLASYLAARCGSVQHHAVHFAYCVGDAKLENDGVGDVSKPVSGKAMCRALIYVSAFLKLDRCVVVSRLGEPPDCSLMISASSMFVNRAFGCMMTHRLDADTNVDGKTFSIMGGRGECISLLLQTFG